MATEQLERVWAHTSNLYTESYNTSTQKISSANPRAYRMGYTIHAFQNDVDSIPFHVCNIFDDIDDAYWIKLFMSILDEQAPIKPKTVKGQVPYMNSKLRKAINQRNVWRGKYFRNRNDKQLRMRYSKWRNRVVKLHKNSIRNYFTHRCNSNVGSKIFYKTITPFLSTKQSYSGSKIVLKENDSIISDTYKVADIFNMYYKSIAEYDSKTMVSIIWTLIMR